MGDGRGVMDYPVSISLRWCNSWYQRSTERSIWCIALRPWCGCPDVSRFAWQKPYLRHIRKGNDTPVEPIRQAESNRERDCTLVTVLHFVTTSTRSRYLEGIADHFDRRRVQLVVGTLDAGGPLHTELASKGIPTFALGCQPRSLYPLGVVRLIQLIKRHGIQVLHTHLVDAGLVGMIEG